MKRTERHHIKEDELAIGVNKFLHFFRLREKEFALAAGVVALAGVLFGALAVVRNLGRARSSAAVGQILQLRDRLASDPSAAAKIEALSGRGRLARVGWIELAAWSLDHGAADKAEAYLAKIRRMPKDVVYYKAELMRARILADRKDFAGAEKILARIESEKPAACPLDEVLFERAGVLERSGDKKGAADLYRRLQSEFPSTSFGYEASMKAARLGGV